MVTLIIPTANRPAMLRKALSSVAGQSAVGCIGRIFVSENGGNRDSATICAEFPSLPIIYRFRPPTSPLEHGRALVRECPQGEFTAFLHDDDWWAPAHLALAIEALKTKPAASAYGACHFVVHGESSMLNCSGNLFPWFGASYAPFQPTWELSRLNVLMASLLGTMAHYSTLVIRTTALREAAYVFDLNNPFDNDRMLLFALSACGPLLFNPVPDVFVRNHQVQDCFTFDDAARHRHMCGTTRWMVETSGKTWEFVVNGFARRMSMCPEDAVHTLKALALKEWCIPEMKRHHQASVQVAAKGPRTLEIA